MPAAMVAMAGRVIAPSGMVMVGGYNKPGVATSPTWFQRYAVAMIPTHAFCMMVVVTTDVRYVCLCWMILNLQYPEQASAWGLYTNGFNNC